MGNPTDVEMEAAKFLQKLIQESTDEPTKLAVKLHVILQHMKTSGKENSMPYQVISRAMETVINEHGLDIEALASSRVAPASGAQLGGPVSSQGAGPSERTGITADPRSFGGETGKVDAYSSVRPLVGTSSGGLDIYQGSSSNISGGAKARGVPAGASLHQPVDTGVSVPMQYSNSVYDNPNFVANMHKDGMGSYSAAPLPVDLSSSKTIGGKELLNDGGGNLLSKANKSIQGDIPSNASESSVPRSAALRDTGKSPSVQAPIPCMPFKDHQLKQLRAQCLVFLAFRNGVTPRKPHLEIALGNFFLKEDVPHRDLVDHKGKEQSIQDPSNVLESSRPSGMLDNSSSTDKSFARQPIGNHLETNLLKDAENCTSVQEERSTQQAMLSEHGKDRRHPSVLMRNSEADIATRHTLESQGSPFRGMQTDFNARNISASSREDNLSNIQQRVGVPNQAHFGMGQAKHVRPDLANWSGNSWQMEASKASISASAMMYDSQFQRRENAVDLCSPADFHNQWRPISVTDGQNNQGAPCRDSDVIFRNITPAQDMDLEEEDASATADKPPSPKYTTYEKWIFERQKRKHLTDQAWAVKQQKTEQKIAASFEKLKENVSSSEDISAKTKSVIELKKLQLLDLQRRLRSEILDDFFNPAAPAIDRVKSIKKTRIGRRSKQLEKYEQKMKEERMKRVRERQKDFFSEVEVHRERLEDASKMKKERWKVFNKYAKEFHKRKERIHREKIDRIQREKINLLKINDVEGYLRMVQDAKSDRVKQLLKETEKYLAKLSSKLQEAKSVARRFESDMDETRMPNFLENNETTLDNEDEADQAKNYLESNEKYYKMAHSVKEHVAGQPSILVGGKLREYQMNGLRWLVSLYNNNLNGILADEMGLGKTVQVISLMCYLMETKNDRGPFLVVVPSSVLPGWESEINFWAPSMHKIIYSGPPEERRKLFKEQILHQKFNVLLTTYEYLMNKHDRPKLSKVLWHYIIIDEGHRIKNASCKLNADLKHYRSSHRLLLTGTPLQNNLEELWALLNFLLPNIFNSSEDFSHWFNKPFQSGDSSPDEALLSEEENLLIINRLHQVLRPFVLRRLKHKVENELPEKIERLVRCEASAYQKLLMKRVEENLGAIGTSKARSVHNSVMELRNICNHPYLSQLHIEEVHDYMPKHYLPHVIRLCGKLEMLDRLLPKLKETDHRVLLFSTMTRLLDVMEEYLCWKQYKYLRLDGHTSGGDRGALIDNFNKSGSPFFIFLLSIRAGGVGVNLQAADTVIIFDTDWNPQVDLQAQARAHRIGQKKDVLVLRLETVQTVEEQVRASAEHKLGVANQSITAGFFDNNTSAEDRREYLESLLRECKKEEAAPVLDDDALNYLIARSESEIDVFESIDKRRKEEETALWSKLAGGDGAEDIEQFPSLPARLLTYDELKPFYEAMNISEAPRPVVVQTAAMKRKGDGLVSLDNQNYGRGKRAREVRSYEEQWTEDEFDKICLVEGPDSPHMKEESGDKNLASVMDGSVMPSSSTQSQPPQQLVNQSYHSPLGTPPVKRGRGRPRKTVTNTYMPSSPGAPLSSSGLSSSGASFFSRPPVSSGSPLSSMTPVSSGGPLFPTAPVSSGAPSSSGAPVSSAAPSSSGEPLSSGAPSSSGAPVSSGVPVTSAGPKTSEAPVSSVAPLSSAEPSSGAPVSSEAPLLSGAEQTTAAAKVDVVPGFQVTSGPASIPGKITSVSVLHSGLSSVDSIGQPVVASQPTALPDPTMPVQGQGRGRGRGRGRGGGRGRGRGRGRGAKVESSGEDPMPIGRGENASVPVSVLPPGALVASKIDLETQGGSILEPSTPHPVSKLPDMAETTVTGPSVSLPPSLASAKGPSASPVPSLASSTGPSASPVPSLASSTGPSASPLPSLAASTTGTSVSSLPSLASSTGPSVSPLPSLASSTAPSVSPLPSLAASTGPSVSPLPSLAASTEPSVSPLPSLASTTGPSVSPLPSLASTIGASVSPRPSLASTRANLVPDPDFSHGPAAVTGPLPPSGDGSRRRGRRKTTVLSTAPPAPISPATSLKNMETKREADSISARSPPDLVSQSLISPEASKTALDVSSSLPQDKSDIRSQQGADGNMLSPPTTISSPGSLPVTAADKQDLVVRNVPSSNPISDLPSGSVVSSPEPATPSAGTKSGRGRGRKTQSGVQASRGRGRRQRSVTPGIPEALTDQNPQSPVTPPNLQSPVTPPNLQSTVNPQNLESTVTPQNVQSTVTPQKRVRVSSIGRRPATRSKPDNTETPISVVQPTASQSPHPVIREVSENKQEAQAQKSIDIIQPKVSDISVDSLVQTIPEAKQVDKTHDVEAPAERLSDPTVTQTVDKKHEDVLSIPVIHDQSNSMDDSEVAINSKSVGGNEDQKQKQLSSQSSVDSSVARTAVSEHGAEVENVVSVQVNEGELTTDTPTSASVVESDSVKIVAENISHVTKVADVQEHEGREDNEGDRLTTVVDSDMDRSVMDPSAVQVSVEVQETRVKEPHNVDKLNQSESNSYPQVEEAGNSKVDEIQKQTEGGLSETVQMTADPIVSDVQSVAIVEHVDEGHECKTGEEGGTEAGPNNESENLVEEQLNNVSVSQDGLALIGETIAMGSVSCSISFNPLGQPPVLDRNPILSEDEDAAASPVFSNTSLTQLTASTTVECTLPPEASNDNLDPKIEEAAEKNSPLEMKNDGSVNYSGLHDTPAHAVKPLEEMMDFENIVTGQHSGEECSRSRDSLNVLHIPGNVTPINDLVERSEIQSSVPGEVDEKEHSGGSVTALFTSADTPAATSDLALYKSEDLCHEEDREEVPSSSSRTVEQVEPESNAQVREEATYVQEKIDTSVKGSPSPTNNLAVESELGQTGKGSNPSEDTCKDGTASSGEVLASLDVLQQVLGENASLLQSTGTRSVSSAEKLETQVLESVDISCREHEAKASPLREQDKSNIVVPIVEHVLEELPNIDEAVVPVPEAQADSEKLVNESSVHETGDGLAEPEKPVAITDNQTDSLFSEEVIKKPEIQTCEDLVEEVHTNGSELAKPVSVPNTTNDPTTSGNSEDLEQLIDSLEIPVNTSDKNGLISSPDDAKASEIVDGSSVSTGMELNRKGIEETDKQPK